MSGDSDVLGVLAGRGHGVVAREELLAHGLTRDAIKHRLATDRLIAIHRGVYAVGHEALSPHARIHAALLAAGPAAAASHATAAFLYRLLPYLLAVVHVTTPASARRSRDGLIVHQTTRPFRPDVVDGLAVTTPLRTLEDLGWDERLVREALARRLIRPEDVPAGAEIAPTQSELERRMRRLCAQAGLPQPICQYPIGPYRIDFAWPDHRLLVETDGFRTHGHRRAFEDDRSRDADLIAQGYTVLRFTWRQITDAPYLVAARLAGALAQRPH